MNTLINFLKRFIKPNEPQVFVPPHVSFKVTCATTKTDAFCGMDLNNPNGTSKGQVKCPCCNHVYKLTIKQDDDDGTVYKAGRNHVFTITAITRVTTMRMY